MPTINSLVASALVAAHAYGKGVTGLQALPEVKTAARKGADTLRALLLPAVAGYYAVGVVVSESPRNKGQQTFDRESKNYEAAKTALRRLAADVMGKTGKKTEEIEIPEELIAAAAKLAKLAQQYEGARSLAAKALAAAFAA